jgi:hypothetical protein
MEVFHKRTGANGVGSSLLLSKDLIAWRSDENSPERVLGRQVGCGKDHLIVSPGVAERFVVPLKPGNAKFVT